MRFKIKRSTVIASLIAVQLSLLFFAVWTLNTRSAYFYTAVNVINIVVVLLIVYGRDHPAYKLTWTIVILAVPVFGILIYFIAGTHYLSHGIRKRLETSQKFNKEYVRQDPKALQRLCDGNPGCARQARYILSSCGRPVYEEGDARLLTPGENMLEALLEEVSKAERYIFLEFFIISQGTMWDQLFALLREKAAAGVEVRIIYDDVGTLDHMSRGFKKVVRAAGIRICTFNPFLPVPSKFMNYRDHRKIAVIDGTAAITGGINIGDEYINVIRPHGHWKDASILLRGGAAESLTVMFLEMWHLITGEELECGRYTCGEHTCGERTCGERTCGDHTCDERACGGQGACGGQPDSKPGFVQP
ncbi:MAG: phospholipase D-like domain-containing protein, partial [Clostridia bacterium]|nr:phospholipase D-like domain-containing protein [Clostridia bacterium]